MVVQHIYNVPTKVLIEQGWVILNKLEAPANAQKVEMLSMIGFDTENFTASLHTAVSKARAVESQQERIKAVYLKEVIQNSMAAEQGAQWLLRLQSRVQFYLAENPQCDVYEWHTRFRFGHLRHVNARDVAYEMRILLPVVESMKNVLQRAKVNDAFIEEGWGILAELGLKSEETDDAKTEREKLTQSICEAETQLHTLLRRLECADRAASLEYNDGHLLFPFDIITVENR